MTLKVCVPSPPPIFLGGLFFYILLGDRFVSQTAVLSVSCLSCYNPTSIKRRTSFASTVY